MIEQDIDSEWEKYGNCQHLHPDFRYRNFGSSASSVRCVCEYCWDKLIEISRKKHAKKEA